MTLVTEEEVDRVQILVNQIQDAIGYERDDDVALTALMTALAIEWVAASEVDSLKTNDVVMEVLDRLLKDMRPLTRELS